MNLEDFCKKYRCEKNIDMYCKLEKSEKEKMCPKCIQQYEKRKKEEENRQELRKESKNPTMSYKKVSKLGNETFETWERMIRKSFNENY